MKQIIDELYIDLKHVTNFWADTLGSKNTKVAGEVSYSNVINEEASIGSMFLSRIIYGCAAADGILKSESLKSLADKALETLIAKFKNPAGGYYWALDAQGNVLHDTDNVNMAQAFVIYGLAEYVAVYGNSEIEGHLRNQIDFVQHTIADKEGMGFYDGFDQNWELATEKTRYFGTHIHLLEAFVKAYSHNQNLISLEAIQDLIEIVVDKFIHKTTYNRLHQVGFNWEQKPGNVWAGHDAECSWILCDAARMTKNPDLIRRCEELALNQMRFVTTFALDEKNGGVFNEMVDNYPADENKHWWPQAETVLGLLNAYQISKDIRYLDKAYGLIGYIKHTFLASNGEWYASVDIKGNPDKDIPKVNFWKSMYHNIRYYVRAIQILEKVNND